MGRYSPQNIYDRQKMHAKYLKGRIDKAFEWGTFVTIRTQVWDQDDNPTKNTTSIPCPLCFDEVRQEARDPFCKTCFGNGWIEENVVTGDRTGGYRDLILARAHISSEPDERKLTNHGRIFVARNSIWVQYNGLRLRDGDIVAEVVVDSWTSPRVIKRVMQKYEVVNNNTPNFTPGPPEEDDLAAQQVAVVTVDRDQPEYSVDMGENMQGRQISFWGKR